jgi:hypothetical protein
MWLSCIVEAAHPELANDQTCDATAKDQYQLDAFAARQVDRGPMNVQRIGAIDAA